MHLPKNAHRHDLIICICGNKVLSCEEVDHGALQFFMTVSVSANDQNKPNGRASKRESERNNRHGENNYR